MMVFIGILPDPVISYLGCILCMQVNILLAIHNLLKPNVYYLLHVDYGTHNKHFHSLHKGFIMGKLCIKLFSVFVYSYSIQDVATV